MREPDDYREWLPTWHLLEDADGNAYVWNSYDGITLKPGEQVQLTAKVLRHDTHPRYGARTVIGWVTIHPPVADPLVLALS